MALNPFFNNFTANNEQTLLADLIVESIKIYGYLFYYLPRALRNFDDLYNQDDMSKFETAFLCEMYIKSVDSFEGEGTFLSKFGLEVRDRISLSVARRSFDLNVGASNLANLPRPREGDLLFFPMTNKLFEIIYVDKRAQFYPLGSLPLYDLQCEVFEYSGEVFATGVTVIDAMNDLLTIDRNAYPVLDANNVPILDSDGNQEVANTFHEIDRDVEWDNDFLKAEANTIIDRTEFDPFSGGNF